MGALSLTASKPQQKRRFAPLVPGVTHVRYPYVYRGCVGGSPQEAEAFALGCARYIEEKLFKTTLPPEEVAAIFVEPIQGEGGYVVAPTVFMQELRASATVTAFCWSPTKCSRARAAPASGGRFEHTGVEPDIVCMAKGIASGMPLGIMMSKAEIMDWVPGSHASTFGGNPVCDCRGAGDAWTCSSAKASRTPKSSASHMMDRIAEWPKQLDLVGDVRGRGLMIGVEIVTDKKAKTQGGAERDRIVELAFERGLLLLGCGPNTIRIAPPLIVTKEQADIAIDVLEECINIVAGKPHTQAATNGRLAGA